MNYNNIEFDRWLMQGCINTYHEEYGTVKDLNLDFQTGFIEQYTNEKTVWKASGPGMRKIIRHRVKEIETRQVEGIKGNKGNTGILIYQGSNDTDFASDWKDNLNIFKTSYNFNSKYYTDIRIHKGFFDQFVVALKISLDIIRQYDDIVITGHSLGGAIAQEIALWIKINYPEKHVVCITFGSPRVGNRAFRNAFNRLVNVSRRYVNNQDMVPKWPKINYFHVAKKIVLNAYKWYEYLIHPITTIIGNPLHHYPQKYMKGLNEL